MNATAKVLPLLLALALPALAADTTEPFDPGFSDVEVYLAHDGFGRGSTEQSFAGEFVLGAGLTDRVSGTIATVHSASAHLTEGVRELGFGLFANAYDSEHVDLDFSFDVGTTFGAEDQTCLRPGLELNWDAADDLSRWGLYGRTGVTVYGHEHDDGSHRLTDVDLTLGAYRSLASGAQLLFEYDAVRCDGLLDAAGWEHGALTFGCNVPLAGSMELINQVSVSVPGHGESTAFGVSVGFISTLPVR